MTIKSVLFDFDGVVIDSEMEVFQYLKTVFSKYHVQIGDWEINECVGTNGIAYIQKVIDENALKLTVEQFFEEKSKLGSYYENSVQLKPMEDVVDLLKLLRKAGIKIGLVSSTRSKMILTALNRMSMLNMFDVIVCGDMVNEKKPSPEGYKKALNLLGLCEKESIAIEDSPTGINAAKNAGLFVVGFKGSKVRQNTSGADLEVSSFRELLEKANLGIKIST